MADIDIGAELLEKIRADFEKRCKSDAYIQAALKKVEAGTASFEDVSLLSQSLGNRLTSAIKLYVKPENLPDGRLYYNIADTILTGSLKDNYEVINSVCESVQKQLDKKAGINIKPQKADFPKERVNALANSVSNEKTEWETVQRRLDAPVRNITESFYIDYVKTNAEFRGKSGLEAYIVRTDHGGCCDWCAKLAGRYRYPDGVPKDVYRRHDNCTCTVTYENGKQRQDVWSKNTWTADEETLDRRKELADKKPTVLTEEQAAEREREISAKNPLTFGRKSGIIKTEEITNAVGKPIKVVEHTDIYAEPNSITQKTSSKGGIERNYYDSNGRQYKQISNNNHGNPKQHPFGENGEHAHDYIYDESGNLIDRPMRELNDEERKENDDIL